MVEKLPDVWGWRDLPVLIAIAEVSDRGEVMSPNQIVDRTGLSGEDVQSAIRALERSGYLSKVQRVGDGSAYLVNGITGAAYHVTGLHRNRDEAVAEFLDLLAQAVEREPDPEKKSKLSRLLNASGDVGGQVLANLIGAAIARVTIG